MPENTEYDPFSLPDEARLRIEQIDQRIDDLDDGIEMLLDERSKIVDGTATEDCNRR